MLTINNLKKELPKKLGWFVLAIIIYLLGNHFFKFEITGWGDIADFFTVVGLVGGAIISLFFVKIRDKNTNTTKKTLKAF